MATVLYTSRCNFRCPFCHNRQIILGDGFKAVSLDEAVRAVSARQGFIEGVVVTGGEPTVYPTLPDLLVAIRGLGIAIKLDTNGYNTDAINTILKAKLVDYIAMDIKTSLPKYSKAAGLEVDKCRIEASVELIKNAGIDYEFRTTCVPGIVESEDVEMICSLIGEGSAYTLQQFQPENTLDPEYCKISPYPLPVLERFMQIACRNTGKCRLVGV